MDQDIEIYRDYLIAKHDPKVTISSVAVKHGITRNGLYEMIKRMENGNVAKIKQALRDARYKVYWDYKYKARFLALPKDRKPHTIIELRKLINDMAKDEFGVSKVSELIGKDRSTVLHHLEK